MSWRIIYIEESDYLSLYLDNMKIVKNEEDILIPLADINTIVVDNYKTTLSVHLLNALCDNNINVVICNIEHLPSSLVIPFGGASQTAINLRKQIEWDSLQKNYVHQEIIKSKIYNQLSLLKHLKKSDEAITHLQLFHSQVELGDRTNREGLSAKMYFRALFGPEFKRFEEDIINAAMNYGYAIIRSQIAKYILAKGYHPSIGIFHKGPTNLFNLADDFIEPFRPHINMWVHNHVMNEKIFTKEHRLELIKLTTLNIEFKDVKQTVTNTIREYIDHVINILESNEVKQIQHPRLNYDGL
ncbi:type II CRISPR-associated endonuclease Cas1 [Methanobacterium sp. YSL]|nr:type II CRISPR-associated endonuclease Cas1 [Methanobacterium sp. YSL]